jgi:hypothetical protein
MKRGHAPARGYPNRGGLVTAPQLAKHAGGLPLLVGLAGDLGQDPVCVGAAAAGPLQLPRPILRRLVQFDAQPIAFRPELSGGELAQVQTAGRVDRQPLLAVPGEGLGELAVAVGGLTGQAGPSRPGLGFRA